MKIITKVIERIENAKQESDSECFGSLLLAGELLTKLTVLGLLAGLEEDRYRHRYRLSHKLVRSDGLGDWSFVIDDVLKGPASHSLCTEAKQSEGAELVQPCVEGSWQYRSIELLKQALDTLRLQCDSLPNRFEGRKWFSLFTTLRNGTRGHGATMASAKSSACPMLEESLRLFFDNFSLLKREWAYLHRNISGKYRVTRITAKTDVMDELRGDASASYSNGVHVLFDKPRHLELLNSNPELTDYYFPNGKFSDKRFELLSYFTDDRIDADSTPYLGPAENLPKSETQALSEVSVVGSCFTNMPVGGHDYIPRTALEDRLRTALLADELDRIITLAGRGGIGKTSLALRVLETIAATERYELICWFSARDIDLMIDGPRQVTADVLTDVDIANSFVRIIEPDKLKEKGFNAKKFIEAYMSRNEMMKMGPILFVFDNFETVRNPLSTFTWLHQFIRHPNKALITARHREFTGDFTIPIEGMSDYECRQLIAAFARKLGVDGSITEEYTQRLIEESDGHPYVMKVLLGDLAKGGKASGIKRIVATQEKILYALFDRTFSSLTPAAQRIFMTLCSWHSMVPTFALQAVMLRPANERMDVGNAVEELRKSSLAEVRSDDSLDYIYVPLAALEFGKSKLRTSPLKSAVQADSVLLQMFGVTQKSGVRRGATFQVDRLFKGISRLISSDFQKLDEFLPILELTAEFVPYSWLLLAGIYEEHGSEASLARAKECVRHYLETAGDEASVHAWERLASLCELTNDTVGAAHALVEMCERREIDFRVISNTANKLNGMFFGGSIALDSDEKKILIRRLAGVMKPRLSEGNADDYSRLAWLFMHLQEESTAREITEAGLVLDGDNFHLLRLGRKLDILR